MSGTEPRRYLIATAISHYPNAPAELEWDRPGLVEARRAIVELFTQELGYTHVSDLGLNPTKHQLTRELREFCRSPERRADDVVAVYIAGHGEVLDNDDYVLLTADTEPDDLYDALLPSTLARKILAGTKVRRLLLMLDTCFSGQGGNELLSAMARLKNDWREDETGLAVITSAQPRELAQTGAFPELLTEAVTSFATAGYTPPLLALDAVVNATRTNPKRPDFQHIGLEIIGLTGQIPPFLPNSKHSNQLSHTDLALQQAAEWDEQDKRRDVEFRTRLLRRAMGHSDPSRVGWWFSGRHQALHDIAAWLADPAAEARPALVVTGAPGSGKTAVLGLVAAVSDPEYRRTVPLASIGVRAGHLPRPKSIGTTVYAQSLTDQQIVRAVAAALRLPQVEAVADLLNHLSARPVPDRPHVVLVDGLDEAATPTTLCSQVLRPLMELAAPHLRLLLGTRPHLFAALGLHPDDHIDLDSPRYADPEAVLVYTVRNLLDAHRDSPYVDCPHDIRLAVAHAVAAAAGNCFLVARITAGTLAATPGLPDPCDPGWRRALPSAAADAMHRDLHQRFGDDAGRILALLRPLAYAEGQGLPWEDIWAPLASELADRPYTNDDLHQLRRDAGAYVVEAVEDGRSVYRLYHESMAEYLRQGQDGGRAQRAFTDVLRRTAPYHLDGGRDWSRAHPYVRRHLSAHAAAAGLLDALVTEPDYLVHADCDSLVARLPEVQSDTARLHASVYRTSIDIHRRLDPDGRRQVLATSAARYNEPALLNAFNSRALPGAWKAVAASGALLADNVRNVLTGHSKTVNAVACTELDGRPVAVTGSRDKTVRVWDLTTGRPVGEPMTGHTGHVRTLACTELDGRPVAVTGSEDATVRVWDLTTGRAIGEPMTGHTGHVRTLACTELDGRPVAVTGSEDATVRVWDLTTGRAVGEPMTGTGAVLAISIAELSGRPVAVCGSIGSTLLVWDLKDQRERSRLEGDGRIWVTALTCTELDGRTVVVGCEYRSTVYVWDLDSGAVQARFTAPDDWASDIVCTEVDGRLVAIIATIDQSVQMMDLRSGEQTGTLKGSVFPVTSLACTTIAGQSIAVGGSSETILVWDLSARSSLGRPVTGHTQWISAMDLATAGGKRVFATASFDNTARIWDARGCRPVGEPLRHHAESVFAIACAVLRGRPVVVSGSLDGSVRTWDMETWEPAGPELSGPEKSVNVLTCVMLKGRPVVVGGALDNTAWVWDLETGRALYPPLRLDNRLSPVAAAVMDGRAVAVVSDSTKTRVLDLARRKAVAVVPHAAKSVGCGELEGRPVVVTGGEDLTVRLWDMRTGQAIGRPMTGHSKEVLTVRCGVLDRRQVVVTGSADSTIRIWDLASGGTLGVIHAPSPFEAMLADDNGLLVCAVGSDVAVFSRD
ncbi:caspase family protein [Streptomyces massasporeus]|uniref:caspase family protein n=3 Tax=Streptomyces massasporeus TaxID=67324 RepID=UPI00381FE884